MTAVEIERIVLFFYLAFLNEERALSASARVVSYFKNKGRLETASRDEMLQICAKSFYKTYDREDPIYPNTKFPHLDLSQVNLAVWQSFSALISREEMLTLLYTHILKATEQEIATVFGVSTGTVRHRMARSLKSFPQELKT